MERIDFSRDAPGLRGKFLLVKFNVRIASVLLVVIAVALGAYFTLHTSEPEFEGRLLSDWLRDLDSRSSVTPSNWLYAAHAVRQIGSNAVPTLLRMLQADDSRWKLQTVDWLQENMSVDLSETLANVHNRRAMLGFRILGASAVSAIPQLQKLAEKPNPQIASQAIMALGEIGTPEILPTLTNAIANENNSIRTQSAGALGALRGRGAPAVPVLVRALHDSDAGLRAVAARSLGEIALEPDVTIPALTTALADSNSMVRASAAMGLGAFGTRAESALPVMRALATDDDFAMRAVSRSILRVQCEMRDGGIIRGPKTEKKIAFVFTGHEFAEGGVTILNELAKHHGAASFFFTGVFLANTNHAPLIERINNEGHYLGPHSDQHLLYCAWEDRRTLVTEEQFATDLLANVEKIQQRTEERRFNRYFLPAFEHYNREIVDWSRKHRWMLINFTPGTRSNADYTGEADKNFVSSQKIFDSIVKKEAEDPHGLNGFILLLHIGSGPGRADKFHARFGELLDFLAAKDYEFVRVDQLLGPRPPDFYRPPR